MIGKQIGMAISALEHRIPELYLANNQFSGNGVSAIKALSLASSQGQSIYTITQANSNTSLTRLQIAHEVKAEILSAVNTGKQVMVSQTNIVVGEWVGVGYIILDPQTGAGAYRISGGSNGGEMSGGFGDLLGIASLLFGQIMSGAVNLVIPGAYADEGACGEEEYVRSPAQSYLMWYAISALLLVLILSSSSGGLATASVAIGLVSVLAMSSYSSNLSAAGPIPQCQQLTQYHYVCTSPSEVLNATEAVVEFTLVASGFIYDPITNKLEEVYGEPARSAPKICKNANPRHITLHRKTTGDHPASLISCDCCGNDGKSKSKRWGATIKSLVPKPMMTVPSIVSSQGQFDDYGNSRLIQSTEFWGLGKCISTKP